MRDKRAVQSSVFENHPDREIDRNLKAVSECLDAHLPWLGWVEAAVGDRHKTRCLQTRSSWSKFHD
jgi:hypothetical protein